MKTLFMKNLFFLPSGQIFEFIFDKFFTRHQQKGKNRATGKPSLGKVEILDKLLRRVEI